MINLLTTLLAVCDPADPIGCVTPPANIPSGVTAGGELPGILTFLNSLLKLVMVVAGLWGFFNLLIAGFGFMMAGGDPKAVTKAWERIWQTFLGMTIIVT